MFIGYPSMVNFGWNRKLPKKVNMTAGTYERVLHFETFRVSFSLCFVSLFDSW